MLIEKLDNGSWSIFGTELGTRTYMGYTKREAIKKYREEVRMKNMSKWEVVQIEAWAGDEEGMWTWNQFWRVGTLETTGNPKRAFTRFLRDRGITFKLNRTIIDEYAGSYEILDRKTREPLFAMMPVE